MELRKDYVLDRWVIIASKRKKRPHQYPAKESIDTNATCYFCPGNEHTTPTEIGRLPKKDNPKEWDMRWFPNMFAAVDYSDDAHAPHPETHNDFFTFASAYGDHEIIAETPDHKEKMHDFSVERITNLLKVYGARINGMEAHDWVRYVNVFKNEGKAAATSLIHSHSQLISLNHIPKRVKDMVNANKDTCNYCKIWQIEKDSFRRCFEDEHTVAFTPYASRFNYELWLFPKTHRKRIADFSEKELISFATTLKKALAKLKEVTDSFNMVVYYAPAGSDLHFHIQILPRIAKFGGFEFLSGTIINAVSPEDAASFYRGEDH